MNNETVDIETNPVLDSLFAQARAEQPLLSDTNFNKVVINRLPSKVSRIEKRSLLFDILGALLGLVAVFLFIEPVQLISAVLSLVPQSLTLSISTLVIGLLGAIGLSFGAWWAVERTV